MRLSSFGADTVAPRPQPVYDALFPPNLLQTSTSTRRGRQEEEKGGECVVSVRVLI